MASLAIDQYYRPAPTDPYPVLEPYLVTDRYFGQERTRPQTIDTKLKSGLKLASSTGELPEPVAQALDRLRELEALEGGWDSYGGRPLNDSAIEPAVVLILEAWRTCNHPRIHLNGRGGLDLFWDTDVRSIEISIDPSKQCEIFFEDRVTGEEIAPDHPVSLEEARAALRRYCAR
jgi:hypothetical protein